MITMHVTIIGRVQGVGYRAWTVGRAQAHGVTGWVRNRKEEGTVEAMFQGTAEQVQALLQECRKGPLAAQVEEVTAIPAEEADSFECFEQWPTH